jgi:hypothetical protein
VHGVFAVSTEQALVWDDHNALLVERDGGVLEVTSDVDTGDSLYVTAVAFSVSSRSGLAATVSRWGRFELRPGPGAQAVEWRGEGVATQAPDGLWVSIAGTSGFRFVPADPLRREVPLIPPRGWQPVPGLQPGDRPLLFPLRRLRPGDPFPGLDRAEVLVPSLEGDQLTLGHYLAPEGTAFQDASGGWLRASLNDAHSLFALSR